MNSPPLRICTPIVPKSYIIFLFRHSSFARWNGDGHFGFVAPLGPRSLLVFPVYTSPFPLFVCLSLSPNPKAILSHCRRLRRSPRAQSFTRGATPLIPFHPPFLPGRLGCTHREQRSARESVAIVLRCGRKGFAHAHVSILPNPRGSCHTCDIRSLVNSRSISYHHSV